MTTNTCNSVYTDPALTYVDLGFATLFPYADRAVESALSQMEAVTGFEVPFHTWSASFDATGDLTPFIRPTKPDLIAITQPADFTIPDAPTVTVSPVALDASPSEPGGLATPPTFVIAPKPGALDATRPGDAPAMNLPTLPDAPVMLEPDLPAIEIIELPDAPDVVVLPFSEETPIFSAAVPDESLNFVESLYGSALMTRIKEQVTAMMDGTYYLPAAVATALWNQSVQREDQSSMKLEQEVRSQHVSRGWDEPNGILTGKLLEVQFQNRAKRGELNRQVYIRSEEVALENLRFGVQQGMALESQLLQAHLTIEERRFQLVVKSKDVALAVFNAHVTQFNAVVQAYNARIEAYKAFLDGLRARVDVYKAQIEGAKIRGDINEQRVRMYAEQIRAEATRAEVYRAKIEGFKAVVDAERAKIDGYRSQVEAYKGLVEAHAAEWDGYRTQVMANAEEGKLYETLARVYATRVGVWQTKGEAKFAEQRANLQVGQAALQQHEAQVRAVLAKLQAATALIGAQVSQNENVTRMYSAEAGVEATASDSNARAFQAQTERNRTQVELALRDASLQVEQLLGIKGLLLEALKTGASASSQLAASSLSALNVSAGVSSNQSRGQSCSTSFNYSGEIIDAL